MPCRRETARSGGPGPSATSASMRAAIVSPSVMVPSRDAADHLGDRHASDAPMPSSCPGRGSPRRGRLEAGGEVDDLGSATDAVEGVHRPDLPPVAGHEPGLLGELAPRRDERVLPVGPARGDLHRGADGVPLEVTRTISSSSVNATTKTAGRCTRRPRRFPGLPSGGSRRPRGPGSMGSRRRPCVAARASSPQSPGACPRSSHLSGPSSGRAGPRV